MPSFGSPSSVGAANANGSGSAVARNDHVHGLGSAAFGTITGSSGATADGVATTAARSDHKHGWALTSQAAGDIAYASSSSAFTRLAIGAATTVLHGGASAPSYSQIVAGDMGLVWTTFTPVITQTNTPTFTTNWCKYILEGKRVTLEFQLTLTAAGGAASAIIITIAAPGFSIANTSSFAVIGTGMAYDLSANTQYTGNIVATAATTLKYVQASTFTDFVGGSPAFTLAIGDVLSGSCQFEIT